jgi:hypothetical protein
LRFAVSICLSVVLAGTPLCFAQKTTTQPSKSQQVQSKKTQPQSQPKQKPLSPHQQFVLDVVRWAVALPGGEPQDQLRVLTAATEVVGPVSSALAKRYAREGAQIEAQLIASGEKPDVSILSAGHFDCTGASAFVGMVPATDVLEAEQSLINIMSACPTQGTQAVRQKLETALGQGIAAPRGLLALMERLGPSSAWSQDTFTKLFRSLPSDADKNRSEAPNFAAMYAQMAPQMDKDVARDAGLRLLEWLSKVSESNERTLAVNITTDGLKKSLGEEKYNRALEADVVARDVANTAGKPAEVQHPDEENVSVLAAMRNNGTDQSSELAKMPPSKRAREAAADGFASGTGGDRPTAERYFDIAFSAADEVWSDRTDVKDAPAIIQEVSEAAAQVDSVSALRRAQHLGDPSAQAIGMLAVARVVLGQSTAGDMASTPPPAAGTAK